MSTSFGRRVRNLRKDRGLSQLDLAPRLGCSAARLSLIERGASPTLDDVERCARALGVGVLDLLGDEFPAPASAR